MHEAVCTDIDTRLRPAEKQCAYRAVKGKSRIRAAGLRSGRATHYLAPWKRGWPPFGSAARASLYETNFSPVLDGPAVEKSRENRSSGSHQRPCGIPHSFVISSNLAGPNTRAVGLAPRNRGCPFRPFLPPTSSSTHFAGNTRLGRWTRRSGSRARREPIAVFADSSLLLEEAPLVVHQLVEQRHGHSAVPVGDGRPFPEAPISYPTGTARLLDG